MNLVSVYERSCSRALLYQLLEEREPHENISHKEMPSYTAHSEFVNSRPYECWYVIYGDNLPVGACYLSKQRELGIGILKAFRGRRYGSEAVRELIRLHPGRLLANINPDNQASIRMFLKLGFGGPIQITLEKP